MLRRSWWAVLVAVAVVVTACADSFDDEGGDATTTASSASTEAAGSTPTTDVSTIVTSTVTPSSAAGGVTPAGFERVAARITAAGGVTCDVCLWLAATPEERAQGLMGVTDLSGADGMVFRWDEPTTGHFWMRDTPLPLSIAFFAADGSFVSSADMTPCLDPVPDAECARYAAAGPYTAAIEVAAGGLPALLIGAGSRLEVFDTACPLAGG